MASETVCTTTELIANVDKLGERAKNCEVLVRVKSGGSLPSVVNVLFAIIEFFKKITSFIMGSGKIYSVTANGYLIVVSASSGKLDYIKRIGDPIASSPIINDGKLYIFTEKSRIFGFN